MKVLIPEIVASTVSYEHQEKLLQLFRHFQKRNPKFITDTTKGRNKLFAFMRHWLDAYNKTGYWIDEAHKNV